MNAKVMNTKLRDFLNQEQINYTAVPHSIAIPAQKVAQVAHVSGSQVAKTVIVFVDGVMAMMVVPAPMRLDFEKIKKVTGAKKIKMAKEYEFIDRFPDCETGAMPPFGNLYEMNVFVSKKLAEDESIYFNAGNHAVLVKMSYSDFNNSVHPILADI